MKHYVALLRGINVGGHNIKMQELRACFESLKFVEVKTFLNSGNVRFRTDEARDKLKVITEAALSQAFNYEAKVQLYDLERLREIIEAYPYKPDSAAQHDYVVFFENGLEEEIVKEKFQLEKTEKISAGDGVVYWQVDKGSTLSSLFSKQLTKSKYKIFNTNRNLRTLNKIVI
jgi:uncharacterized protein (DUF1697 family)